MQEKNFFVSEMTEGQMRWILTRTVKRICSKTKTKTSLLKASLAVVSEYLKISGNKSQAENDFKLIQKMTEILENVHI